jgi:hypothetical protein
MTNAVDDIVDDDLDGVAAGRDRADLGPFDVRSWDRAISIAVPDLRPKVFRDACTEAGRVAAMGAGGRAVLGDALAELAVRHGLHDPLGGIDGVQEIIAGAFEAVEIERSMERRAANGHDNSTPKQTAKREPIRLTYFRDCGASVNRRWLLKGVIAKGETSNWFGPPGSGKSAVMTELSVHSASRRDWRGHKAKEGCGVLILALERADLYRRRLYAYRLRDGLPASSPIAVSSMIIGLLNTACVDLIVDMVRAAEAGFGYPVGLIVIDTFNKGIAVDGGDEDKARDQNRAAANLREVHNRLDVHIALVGHTGKDETRGVRGSNAQDGDGDVMVMVSGETAEVTKANDQPERVLFQYRLERFEFGLDEDGDQKTTSILSSEVFEPAAATAKKKTKLTPLQKAGLRILFDLIADGETAPKPNDQHVPTGVSGVSLDQWRERLVKKAKISKEPNTNRTQFRRLYDTLESAGKIGIWDGFVWPCQSVSS